MGYQWLTWAKQIQSTAQAGLSFSKDKYDLERYRELLKLSAEILSTYTNPEMEEIHVFLQEKGYQTPKIDVRAVVFQDDKILLVQEKVDHSWALPGGFADVGNSLVENVVRELEEETGFQGFYKRLLAVLDYQKHPHPPQPFHYYKCFIECSIRGEAASETLETSDVQFFPLDRLPKLSKARNTASQIAMLFEFLNDPDKLPIVD